MSDAEERSKKAEYMRRYMSLPGSKEKKVARDKKYREQHHEKLAEKASIYWENNKQSRSDYHKVWRAKPENKEKISSYTKKRIESGACRRQRLKKYGITLEQYNKLLEEQDHKCAVCKRPNDITDKSMPVDYSHKTGQIRGLLCNLCNRALGLLREDKEVISNLLRYLDKYTK